MTCIRHWYDVRRELKGMNRTTERLKYITAVVLRENRALLILSGVLLGFNWIFLLQMTIPTKQSAARSPRITPLRFPRSPDRTPETRMIPIKAPSTQSIFFAFCFSRSTNGETSTTISGAI